MKSYTEKAWKKAWKKKALGKAMEKYSFEDQDEDRVHDAHIKGYFSPVGSASPIRYVG